MSVSEQLKILCVKLGISASELARFFGRSPQAFGQKMKRESIYCPWCDTENGAKVTSGIITTQKVFTKGGASK